jgi:TetR/AcrR family transcriptional regulator
VGPGLLLKAARELLKRLPPAKVTRAALARHANVDPGLIRYYFADRDSLLLAVVEDIIDEYAARLAEWPAEGTPPQRLRHCARAFFDFNIQYPYVHRLLAEQTALPKSARARKLSRRVNQLTIDLYSSLLDDGLKDQSLRAFDPIFLHVALIGMSEFFVSSAQSLLKDALGNVPPADYAERYADTVVGLILDGARRR